MNEFLKELKELMLKHNIYIIDQSCNCCGPSILADELDNKLIYINDAKICHIFSGKNSLIK